MSYDLDRIRSFAEVSIKEEGLLTSIQRPIVLLRKKNRTSISPEVAPRNRYFGAMLPYTPLHYLLLDAGFTALVMTSGNLSEEPIAIDNEDAFERLEHIADYFLIHNRDIYLRSDDSIVRRIFGETRPLRRSRGYVPVPVFLKKDLPNVLAVGAELKNTVCLTRGGMAFLSQHIGDLENLATLEFLELTIRHMKRILAVEPEFIAHDLHPDYLSTRWAMGQTEVPKIGIQHHHAHIVGAMAENRLDGPVIGLAFDGTGYGTDHTIWGGEVLVADETGFERAAHLAAVPMPGSSAAIKEPWRMAVSYLSETFGEGWMEHNLPIFDSKSHRQLHVIQEMARKRFNAPLTSSLGRLFDGVAAIIGLRYEVAFEGQAAMELEMVAAATAAEKTYDTDWILGDGIEIQTQPLVRGIVRDVENGISAAVISARFHGTLIRTFTDVCEHLRKQRGIHHVVLSGGVFQNAILLSEMLRKLAARNFNVYTHKKVPCNDGGISLGQAVAAAAMLKRRCGQ